MSVRLNIGDAVLVNTRKDSSAIGVIKYIGGIHGCDMMTEYVGIELVEAIDNGHTGSIDGYQYFSSPNGHGFHTKLTNVIRKVLPLELITELREMMQLMMNKLIEKDKYIQHLTSRRHSSSSSCNLDNMTPKTSMTPITEHNNCNDMNFKNLDIIQSGSASSEMSSDCDNTATATTATTTATTTDNECSSSAISSQYDSRYSTSSSNYTNTTFNNTANTDDDESKWRKHKKKMKKIKRRKKKGMKKKNRSRNNNHGKQSISVSKSSRKHSIIKPIQNMQQIGNNMICNKQCHPNQVNQSNPYHPNIPHQPILTNRPRSTPTVFISPIPSNNNNNNNQLSPNYPNAILLDPPSPSTYYNGYQIKHSFSNLQHIPPQTMYSMNQSSPSSISPHTPYTSETQRIYFDPRNIKYNNNNNQNMIPSLSAMSKSSLSVKKTVKRINSSQSIISPHTHYDDISYNNTNNNKMYSLSNNAFQIFGHNYNNNNISK